MTNAVRLLAAAAVTLCTEPVFAQNAPGQEPPLQADPGTTIQASCIDENDGYERRGTQPMFVVELKNKCEKRMSCKVFVFITSAKGMAQGHGTIVMAEKSKGATATGRFIMKAKMMGGSSQSTRECKVLS